MPTKPVQTLPEVIDTLQATLDRNTEVGPMWRAAYTSALNDVLAVMAPWALTTYERERRTRPTSKE